MSQRRIKSFKTAADWQPLPPSFERAFSEVERQMSGYFDEQQKSVRPIVSTLRR
jgi:hypothetical protein